MASGLLGIALTGLQTSQTQLSVTGHNITNANQEGYTRQRADLGTNQAQFASYGYTGSGVNVQSIDRLANEFLVSQIRLDTSAFNQVDAFSSKVGEIDSLLASDSISLSNGFSSFFSSMQAATDDPTSIPVRQLVLAEANVLSQRFTNLYGRFNEANDIVNQELDASAKQISSLAQSLADINESVVGAMGSGSGAAPNDLLDERDEIIRKLAELVSVSSFTQSDGAINVSVGDGQTLVIGNTATRVIAVPGASDSQRKDIAFVSDGNIQIVTDKMTGGRVGGLLDFRDDVLDRSLNELGRMALVFTDAMNYQQSVGLDLDGNFGVPLFEPINNSVAMAERVVANSGNQPPDDRVLGVEITDPSLLSNSDYELKLSGSGPNRYDLVRLSDDRVVQSGGLSAARPTTIEYESFSINLSEGSFQDGDRFTIMPSRFSANGVEVIASTPEVLAFAQPISTENSLSNTGSGQISQGDVIQTTDPVTGELLPAFANLGSLAPPLMVRFTSPTSYDVLDITDPANPKSLQPPLENRVFIPGQTNEILPSTPGQTLVESDGFNAGRIPRASEMITGALGTEAPNSYQQENISISYTDPITGTVSSQPLIQHPRGGTAEQLALTLSSYDGVTASAFTETQIRIVDDGTGVDFKLHLNGVDLVSELAASLAPAVLPSPLTNDLIAQAINDSGRLAAQGISAVSDGDSMTITARSGADLRFQVEGDEASDFIQIKGDDKPTQLGTLDLRNGANLTAAGPNSFQIDIFDGPNKISNPKTIDLDGAFVDGDSLVNYLQSEVDQAYGVAGKVLVSLNIDGSVQFTSANNSPLSQIEVSGTDSLGNDILGADPLGLTVAASQGPVGTMDTVMLEGPGANELQSTADISLGATFVGPAGSNSFTIDIFDGPSGISNPQLIDPVGTFADGASLVTYLQGELDAAYGTPNTVTVSQRIDGTLSFTSSSLLPGSQMQMSSLAGPDPLGLAPAVARGVITTTNNVNSATVGGSLSVVLEQGFSLSSSSVSAGNLFTPEPEASDYFIGYSFSIAGNPDQGDEFSVNYNADGVSDNRNALKFVGLETSKLIGGNVSLQESYGDLVEFIGTTSSGARINQTAAEEILKQSKDLRSSVSGVNLDEEASNLIRYELTYNASARVISVARDLFDTLLQSF